MRAAADLDLELADEDRGLRFLAADRAADLEAATDAVKSLLLALGFDIADEGLRETPGVSRRPWRS